MWSLAAIAYECLTGRVPFEGGTGPAILLAILSNDPKPPSETGAAQHVPATLDPVIETALAKDPIHRIGSAGALVDRIGAAYGLTGSHAEWAAIPQDDLGRRIREGLPAALAAHRATAGNAGSLAAMDSAFQEERPAAFTEDLVMGVPARRAGWLIPLLVFVLVGFGAAVALVFLR